MCGGDGQSDPQGASLGTDAVIPRSTGTLRFLGSLAYYDPNINFWLGSIAMDKNGDIALGFSASSRSLFPSIYEGVRAATDPLGSMSGPLIITNGRSSILSIGGAITARCQLIQPTTAPSGTPTSTIRPPAASTGIPGWARSDSALVNAGPSHNSQGSALGRDARWISGTWRIERSLPLIASGSRASVEGG